MMSIIAMFVLLSGNAVTGLRLQKTDSAEGGQKPYSIFINTWKRPACLKLSVEHYKQCANAAVRVTWSETRAAPAWLKDYVTDGTVQIDRFNATSLSNRFVKQPLQSGPAIFMVDDDILYSCHAVDKAYEEFQKDTGKMVGFGARLVEKGAYVFPESYKQMKANTVFITKGGFLHPSLLDAFFDPKYDELRATVDKHVTGEDMLMSFIHMKETRKSVVPLLISNPADVQELKCRNPLIYRVEVRSKRRSLLKQIYDSFEKEGVHAEDFTTDLVWMDGAPAEKTINLKEKERTPVIIPDFEDEIPDGVAKVVPESETSD